jgi:hypothetical protein
MKTSRTLVGGMKEDKDAVSVGGLRRPVIL